MHNYYQVAVRYEKTIEDGRILRVTESFIVDALSFTEAEARITAEMRPYVTGEFEIARIQRRKIAELFPNPNGDRWYRCKVLYITIDEEKGIEKHTAHAMYVQANSIADALEGLVKGMEKTLADYEVFSITETDIMDVVPYEAPAKVND